VSDGIQPFRIQTLHDRLGNVRWPGELPGVEWTWTAGGHL
jgi:hypothetical protein